MMEGKEIPETCEEWNDLNKAGKEEVVQRKIPFWETSMSPRWVLKEIQNRRMLLETKSVLKVLRDPIGISEDGFDQLRLR